MTTPENTQFYKDVIASLSLPLKQLPSKYFYDATGDKIFQDIMGCDDYYLTKCEMEIFTTKTHELVNAILKEDKPFDIIELGAGDCTKSIHLLKGLMQAGADFNYMPIDISEHVIQELETTLPVKLPGLNVVGLNGDYFQMLQKVSGQSGRRKIILCLGANIANMPIDKSHAFCNDLRKHLSPGDMTIIGFDLKKNPKIIRAAYNDKDGFTAQFNLNLLRRMNRELDADFNIDLFEHYCSYDPESGSCKSYLVCLDDMTVTFPGQQITFKKDECIWLEISQKHTIEQISNMASANGFQAFSYLADSKNWFTDAIWIAS